jgi:molybdopterin synthase catalytic subunit
MSNIKKDSPKNVFLQGAISPAFISESIAKHSSKHNIGAHNIFLGQVRDDIIGGKTVRSIEYSTYADMAQNQLHLIREAAFEHFALTCLHIHHSLGEVRKGEICLFVFTSAPHRHAAVEACAYIVERIKAEVPIWGKEIFEDESFVWKVNT